MGQHKRKKPPPRFEKALGHELRLGDVDTVDSCVHCSWERFTLPQGLRWRRSPSYDWIEKPLDCRGPPSASPSPPSRHRPGIVAILRALAALSGERRFR